MPLKVCVVVNLSSHAWREQGLWVPAGTLAGKVHVPAAHTGYGAVAKVLVLVWSADTTGHVCVWAHHMLPHLNEIILQNFMNNLSSF